jgi:outer membrane protein OmpA-like peptidoglycan-associated protein/opacity protein-like surface antigen
MPYADRFNRIGDNDMRGFLGIFALLAMVAGAVSPAAAEELEGRWGVQLEGGMWKLVEGYWDHSNVDKFTGMSIRRGLSPRWIAELSYRYGAVRPGVESPTDDAGWTTDHFGTLATEIHNPSLTMTYMLRSSGAVRPFVGAGLGVTSWRVIETDSDPEFFPSGITVLGYGNDSDEYQSLKDTNLAIATELGLEFFLSDAFSLRLGGRYHILTGNDLDNVGYSSTNMFNDPQYVDANKGLVQGFVGATLWFGGPRDSDRDGVVDRDDRCPRAAEDYDGFQDEDGCPDYDNDKDGIPDTDDPCPLDPEDRDGFQDDDGCPDPDNDGDGVIDADDACPDEAEDKDGFEDGDGCPDIDNDGDGVPDAQDRCPDTPAGATVDADGCVTADPGVVLAPAVRGMEAGLVLEGVAFRSGSAQLTAGSIGVLADTAEHLKANPDIRVEVQGFTDSTGPAEANRELSQRRAMAVRDVLIQLGVAPSRLTAVGYGEAQPIADNDTAEGRARNRRVQLKRID